MPPAVFASRSRWPPGRHVSDGLSGDDGAVEPGGLLIHQARTGVIECRVTRSPGNKYAARIVLVNKLKNCKALKDFHAC